METVIKEYLKIFPKPHSKGQEEFLTWKGSIIAFAGRRWGKTLIACIKLIIAGMEDPGLYWWVGLSWKSASMKRAWKTLKKFHKIIWLAIAKAQKLKKFRIEQYIRENEKELTFPTIQKDGKLATFTIWLRTADNPDSLQGEGVKGLVVDECAFMPKEVWDIYLEPTTIDFGAWVILISSSNGCNWYDDLWNTKKKEEGKEGCTWIAREYETFENTVIMNNPKARAKLEEIIANTDPLIVDQVYKAKRIATVNKCFDPKAVKDCRQYGVSERPYRYGNFYVASVDGSGGGQNQYAFDISHKEIKNGQEIYIQDVKLAKSFAHTKTTTKEYADKCKNYKIGIVVGDKYSGDWIINEFLSNGIVYEQCEMTRSDCYNEARPVINQRRVEFLDYQDTEDQLICIEGKIVGDHYKWQRPPHKNDDSGNVLAISIMRLSKIQVLPSEIHSGADTGYRKEAPELLEEANLGIYETGEDISRVFD